MQNSINSPVDKLMDKSVDKGVDKFEDNSVDNSASQPNTPFMHDTAANIVDGSTVPFAISSASNQTETIADQTGWYSALADQMNQWYPQQTEAEQLSLKQLIIRLGQAIEQGHTCIKINQQDRLNILPPLFKLSVLVDENQANLQPAPLVWAGDYVYFYRQWQQEHSLAVQLTHILAAVRPVNVQFDADEKANPLQRQAIELAAQHAFSLITGGPGTGKTFTLVRIVKALQQVQPDLRIALAAPTGKAAQRMQSVLDEEFTKSGIASKQIQTAQTIHRLLGLGTGGKPRYHAQVPLPYDLIVLDEGSMLDLALASLLFAAIAAGTRLIILGDAHQLAAVDAGAVLADLQNTPALRQQQIELRESKRFKSTEGIGQLASAILSQDISGFWHAFEKPENHAILHHIDPQVLNDVALFDQLWQGFLPYVEAVNAGLPVTALFIAFDRYRILSAMRSGRLGVKRINQEMSKRLQQTLQHGLTVGEWFNGRPILIGRNDYSLQLSNGDIGLCLADNTGKWQVYFPHLSKPIAVTRLAIQDTSTAFAMTIHKSQGSEFEQVAVMLDAAAEELLSRELLYTAITRARSRVDLWSERQVTEHALGNRLMRHTGLQRQLQRQLQQQLLEVHNIGGIS